MDKSSRTKGFSLVETLTALVVLGTLSVGLAAVADARAVKFAARKSQAKSVFAQWATACTFYKKEYGAYLPNLGPTYDASKDVLHKLDDAEKSLVFVKCLYGKNLNGTALSSGASGERVRFNRQAMEFCAFSQDDFFNFSPSDAAWQSNPILQDRLGNTAIRVCFDLNNDGLVKSVPGVYPDELLDAGAALGVPGRVIIFTTKRDVGQGNPKLDPIDAADVVVIQ
jgi:prepilin-type N-terminal cleavage/methylation domain-containing protein